jgi:hypothetical protein
MALALFTLILGYTSFAITGSSGAGLFGGWINSSGLVNFLKDFFNIPLGLMRFLFPGGLPQPLAFFASG